MENQITPEITLPKTLLLLKVHQAVPCLCSDLCCLSSQDELSQRLAKLRDQV